MRHRTDTPTPRWSSSGGHARPVAPILFALILSTFCAACFDLGDFPIFPTGGPTASMPAASLVAEGELVIITPDCLSKCELRGTLRNKGFGCATRVHGTTRFVDGDNDVLAVFDWSLAPELVVRPEQTAEYVVTSVPKQVVDSFAASATDVLWTNVRC